MTMYDLLKMFCEDGADATKMWLTAANVEFTSSNTMVHVTKGRAHLGLFVMGSISVNNGIEGECVQANWCKYKSNYPTYDRLRPDLKKALMEARLA